MQLIKKIFGGIFVLAIIVVMAAFLCFGAMMLFHISIFGYTYASELGIKGNVYNVASADVQKIEIETSMANIKIINTNDAGVTDIAFSVYQDFQGIVKNDVMEVGFEVEPTAVDGTLKLKLKEPNGLFLKNSSYLSISVPQDFVLDNLTINTNAKNVDFGSDDHNFKVKNLTLISQRKTLTPVFNLSDKLIVENDLYVETFGGRVNVESYIGRNVEVKTTTGAVNFNKDINGDLIVHGFNPSVEVGVVQQKIVDGVENGTITNLDSLKKVNVNGNVIIENEKSDQGSVKISGTVSGYVYINAPNIQFWANNVEDGLNCESGSNNIRIFGSLCKSNVGKTCVIKNGDGHLFINDCYAKPTIKASKNGVYVKNAYEDIVVDNENNDTKINFAETVANKTLTITQEKGNVYASNISGTVNIKATNGNINADFRLVVGHNVIEANRDAIVTVNDGNTFALTTKVNSANVDVKLGSVTYDNMNSAETINGYKQRTDNINTTQEENLPDTLLVWSKDYGKVAVTANIMN